MRYFVIGANGELYGPADVATLNQWILEGRITPTTEIQEELGGARFAASLLPELAFGTAAFYGRLPGQVVDNGESEMKNAWIFGIIGFFCFGIVLGPIGLYYAMKAKQKGHPQALGGIFLCAIVTIFAIIGFMLILSGNNPLERLLQR